jgi:hypothetical protein
VNAIRNGDWRRPALLIFTVATIAMALVLVWVGRWLSVWFDEWNFIFGRQTLDLDSFLRPHVDGFVAVPAAVYYVLLHVWGLSSYYPFLVADWLAHLACVGLLGYIVSRKSGVLVGLMAALSLLFLGSAYEALLQPFQMQYLFSAAGGLAAFALLDRANRRRRDYVLAGAALLIAIASSGVGPIITGMVFVWAMLKRDRAAALTALPALVIYGIWYVGWFAHLSRVAGTADNLPLVPIELLYGLGAAIVGVLGLPPMRFAWVGAGIGIAVVVGLAWIARIRGWRPAPLAVAAVFALVVEYTLQAVFRGAFGIDHGARSAYLYPAAIYIWLAVAGTIGHRLDPHLWTSRRRPWVPALVGLLIVPMALGNMVQFWLAGRAMQPLRESELRELALTVQLRDTQGLALDAMVDDALLPVVTPRDYFVAIDQFDEPRIALGDPGSDLPGPDATQLNAMVARLLGGAVTIGPFGEHGPTAPVVTATIGTTAPDTVAGCTTITSAAGQAAASWSPPSSGVSVVADRNAIVEIFLGLYEPADAPINPLLLRTILRGDTFWLPDLPAGLSWIVSVKAETSGALHICSRVPSP